MRLADELLGACGSMYDVQACGAITSLPNAIQTAQRFELSEEVVGACRQVSYSRPSSILSALPFARLPYSRVWLEWFAQFEDATPRARMGCLCEASDETLTRGTMTWAQSAERTDLCVLHPLPSSLQSPANPRAGPLRTP